MTIIRRGKLFSLYSLNRHVAAWPCVLVSNILDAFGRVAMDIHRVTIIFRGIKDKLVYKLESEICLELFSYIPLSE